MKRIVLVAVWAWIVPSTGWAFTYEDVPYEDTITVDGKTLKLVGVGLREVTIFRVDVYTAGFYAEHPTCNLDELINKEQTRVIRLHFLRDVSASKMRSKLSASFKKHTPKDATPDLRAKVKKFVATFGIEAKEGNDVVIRYIPGKGTTLFIDGKQRGGTFSGFELNRIIWHIYLAPNTCCSRLRSSFLKTCKRLH